MTRHAILLTLLVAAGCVGTIDEPTLGPLDSGYSAHELQLTATFDVWDDITTEEPAALCWDDDHTPVCARFHYGEPVVLSVDVNHRGTLFVDGGDLVASAAVPLSLQCDDVTVQRDLYSRPELDELYADAGLVPDSDLATLRVEVTVEPQYGNPNARPIVYVEDSIPRPFVIDRIGELWTGGENVRPLPFAPEAPRVDVAWFMNLDPAAGPYAVTPAVVDAPYGEPAQCETIPYLELYADTMTLLELRCW